MFHRVLFVMNCRLRALYFGDRVPINAPETVTFDSFTDVRLSKLLNVVLILLRFTDWRLG